MVKEMKLKTIEINTTEARDKFLSFISNLLIISKK